MPALWSEEALRCHLPWRLPTPCKGRRDGSPLGAQFCELQQRRAAALLLAAHLAGWDGVGAAVAQRGLQQLVVAHGGDARHACQKTKISQVKGMSGWVGGEVGGVEKGEGLTTFSGIGPEPYWARKQLLLLLRAQTSDLKHC